jgi:hypothetical protein
MERTHQRAITAAARTGNSTSSLCYKAAPAMGAQPQFIFSATGLRCTYGQSFQMNSLLMVASKTPLAHRCHAPPWMQRHPKRYLFCHGWSLKRAMVSPQADTFGADAVPSHSGKLGVQLTLKHFGTAGQQKCTPPLSIHLCSDAANNPAESPERSVPLNKSGPRL